MGTLVAKIEKFEIRKTEPFNFIVLHAEQGKVGTFRTEQRARDTVEMFVNPDCE